MIISIQTFGDLLIWHPHIHCLVTDGAFDATGNFHPIPKIDTEKAMIIFREKVFKMLKDNNRISDTLIFKMRHWNHSGFSVNNEVYINKDNPEALERLKKHALLLCGVAPPRSTSATLRSGSATKHEQMLTSQSHSITLLLYEKLKDF